jgi:hypothetical protein
LSAGEGNTLDLAQVEVLEPRNEPEVEIVKADATLLVTADEILIIDSHQDVDR